MTALNQQEGSVEPSRLAVVRRGGEPGGAGLFWASSRTTPGARYTVAVTPERIVCSCPGYANRHACWHVGVVAAELAREQRQQRAARHAAAERGEEIASEFGL